MTDKKEAFVLSPEDEKKIVDGEFFITEVETLRLQRLDALGNLWAERVEVAKKSAIEADAKAKEYQGLLRAEIEELKLTYGLSDGHGVDLGDNTRGRIFVSPQS